jgi:hypothetical protein
VAVVGFVLLRVLDRTDDLIAQLDRELDFTFRWVRGRRNDAAQAPPARDFRFGQDLAEA